MLNGNQTLAGYFKAHLSRLGVGKYFALLAYIEMNEAHELALQAMSKNNNILTHRRVEQKTRQ